MVIAGLILFVLVLWTGVETHRELGDALEYGSECDDWTPARNAALRIALCILTELVIIATLLDTR